MKPRRKPRPPPPAALKRPLLYKVIELSTVDEASLERTVNEWVPFGWTLDGVQFAMRESSKRPSMAFVFFTRVGPALSPTDDAITERHRTLDAAQGQLKKLADEHEKPHPAVSAWQRLTQLAGDDE